jgi:hypothetical protein
MCKAECSVSTAFQRIMYSAHTQKNLQNFANNIKYTVSIQVLTVISAIRLLRSPFCEFVKTADSAREKFCGKCAKLIGGGGGGPQRINKTTKQSGC